MQTKIRQQEDVIHEMEEQLEGLTKERDKVRKQQQKRQSSTIISNYPVIMPVKKNV